MPYVQSYNSLYAGTGEAVSYQVVMFQDGSDLAVAVSTLP